MDKMKMAQRLKDLRMKTGKSQAEVAKTLDISLSSYTKYEAGIKVPRDEMKVKIADFYGQTVQNIFFS